jgi:deferrochelatase/peroxidase EfeB
VPRGAIFLFITAKAMTTIEFMQQEWINDGNFIGIGDERDPIIGLQQEGAVFTIPHEPVRRRVHSIETFNVLRGGEYSSCRAYPLRNGLRSCSNKGD